MALLGVSSGWFAMCLLSTGLVVNGELFSSVVGLVSTRFRGGLSRSRSVGFVLVGCVSVIASVSTFCWSVVPSGVDKV